ncbi:MAG: zf-HC2 domain-containing protein [Clostridiaceae bacterium]|nr:zf-HC2 domain-containing protein [Clostridiaceae bacterium]
MPCPYKHQLPDYLEEKLSPEKMKKMEEHIDLCDDCQQKLDELLDHPLKLQQQTIEISDEILVEKIKAHRKGIRRIYAYGFLGFLLGLFSLKYTSDSFIVTKAIMALPYKLAEFMLGIFFSRYKLNQWDPMYSHFQRGMGYFPYNPILGLIVELVTPALVAMFLAMAVGYLTSDKRVFQRKRILRFILSATMIFALWFGAIYGVYNNTLTKIENLEGIKSAIIYEKQEFSTSWIVKIDQYNLHEARYNNIISGLSEATSLDSYPAMNLKEGLELLIQFQGGGQVIAHVDTDTGTMFMGSRHFHQLSDDTLSHLIEVSGGIK